ncbi:unnamed protein product, partial [Vitis vinifera]
MANEDVPIQINDDVLGLIVFKSGLHDPSSRLDSWSEDDDSPCSWEFVQCNPSTGRVSEVSVDGLGLSGKIGRGLEKLQNLKVLSLSFNNFSGSISPELALITGLERLNLSHNSLSGRIPSSLSNMTSIRFLDLSHNSLAGPIPDEMFENYSSLRSLSLSMNFLEGPIPSALLRCTTLSNLNLSSNQFSAGDFPQWIGSMSSVEYVDFSGNGFTGSLPASMGNLKSLQFLSLSDNRLTGSIPGSLFYCPKLSVIRLRGNGFSGSIPEGLFDLGLDEVDLSGNELEGPIPPGSSRLFESLHSLDLSRNKLTGSIPAEIGLFSSLRYLNLSWNSLRSRMPPELGYFQNLTVLDLRNTFLFGSIPGDICDSGSLGILQLDGNSLTGPIPDEFGNCSSLYLLSMSHNELNGSIPKSFAMLKKLEILRLEFNELSGEIPRELGSLENLLAVNVSYNRLIGRLPVGGIFQSLDQSALQGNLGICSPLLKGPCKLNVSKPLVLDPYDFGKPINGQNRRNESTTTPMRFRHHMFLSVSAIIAITAAAFILIGVVSMCSSSSRSGSPPTGKLILFDSRASQDWIANPENLLNKAAEIGGGVFGTVYKVSLGGGARMVAIKKLVTSNIIQYPEDFDREVRILGKARHQNLISLKGYYWTPQLQLLVTDYAPNGSLQARLHERPPTTPPLSWPNRFRIILGTAKGLAHLHHSFRPPIIHYNLKPSNILLDENCNPMISDYGLARLLTKLDKHVISSRFQSVASSEVGPGMHFSDTFKQAYHGGSGADTSGHQDPNSTTDGSLLNENPCIVTLFLA